MQRIHDRYELHAMSALWEMVERIRCWNRQLAARLDRGVARACQDELQRVVLAPETTSRLLRRGPYAHGGEDAEVGRFLYRSFLAEAARVGSPGQSDDVVWTALGDGRLLPGGEFVSGPSIPAFVPLDVDSPHISMASGSAGGQGGREGCLLLDEDERRVTFERLTASRDLIRNASDAVGAFVARFTKVLVLRRDDRSLYSSASSGQHIGRCLLGQPHAPDVDEIHLAEALVHQAVHTLLRVQELLEPRVLGPAAHETASRVRSPWTGHPLPVRSFLRECFVRYGLLNFWCLALGVGASDPERIRERMREALRGFVAAPLLDTASAHAAISDAAKSAIGEMQEVVASYFDAVVA
jgi:hypothetical protein